MTQTPPSTKQATKLAITSILAVLGLVAACGGKGADGPRVGNGVNDVRKACEIRGGWVPNSQNQCDICAASVLYPPCGCSEIAAFNGACLDQQDARKSACPSTIDDCVNACKSTDCDCLDKCYASDANCKAASAARDGCVADACAQYCK
jgi:hypothetical protein